MGMMGLVRKQRRAAVVCSEIGRQTAIIESIQSRHHHVPPSCALLVTAIVVDHVAQGGESSG